MAHLVEVFGQMVRPLRTTKVCTSLLPTTFAGAATEHYLIYDEVVLCNSACKGGAMHYLSSVYHY